MDRDDKIALGIISDILGIHNREIDKLQKRVEKLEEVHNDYEYIDLRIPRNASNLDVLRKVFNCKIINDDNYGIGITHLDIDIDTIFNTSWLKTRYIRGCENETDQ